MIKLENVSKSYPARGGRVPILRNINLTVSHGQKIGILGRNGAGKSTLIRLVSGAERPSSGTIHRQMSVSWPLAFGGAFLGRLTGYDNYRFVCRLHGVAPESQIDFVEDFCELGPSFREPLRTYSAGMRARLAFAVSMAVEFDCFLIDEIIAVGDSRFQAKCFDELFVKRADRALLIVSHHAEFVREFCTSASVLERGVLRSFDSVDEAYELYSLQQSLSAPSAKVPVASPDAAEDAGSKLEATMGDAMEERSRTLALTLMDFDQEGGKAELMPVVLKAFTADLGDLTTALRVVDHVKALGTPAMAARLMMAMEPLHGQNSLFHVVLGDLLAREGRTIDALTAYRRATDIEPQSFWGQRNLGVLLFNIGSHNEALASFSRALALPGPDTLRLELVRYLIDCATYLDRAMPHGQIADVCRPGDTIEEVTALFYPGLGIFSVRVQGYLAKPASGRCLQLSFDIAGARHVLALTGPACNSFRRHAALVGAGCFGTELVIRCSADPSAVSVQLLEGDKTLAKQLSVGVQQDGRELPPNADPDIGNDALAALAYRYHDYEACVLFSRLALAEGATVDHEALSESLIHLGRYHEVEDHLARLLTEATSTGSTASFDGPLFDLLCAEIGRSRLPGWKQRLEQLVSDRLTTTEDASGHTNAGHLQVLDGRLEAAAASYARAAEAAADRNVIHFNRGIFSAQFLQQAHSVRPGSKSANRDVERTGQLVHLVSCDGVYFKRYGPAVVRSSRTTAGNEATAMHVHIVDPDAETLVLVRELLKSFDFNLTTEFFPFDNAARRVRIAYYTSARFIIVPKLLEMYQTPVLITETDYLLGWDWPDIIEWCAGADFGSVQSSLTNLVPWTRIPAGIAYFDHRDRGKALAKDLSQFLTGLFHDVSTHKFDLWTIDQVALWRAWERHHHHLESVHLPMYSMLQLAVGDKTNIL